MPPDRMRFTPTRRKCLQWLGALPVGCWAAPSMGASTLSSHPSAASDPRPTVLAACWEQDQAFCVGLLTTDGPNRATPLAADIMPGRRTNDGALREVASLILPTRAHGLWAEPGGSLLVVARRPGDWLLRWFPDGRPPRWQWIEAQRAFNGHAVVSADGLTVYTTETDLDSGVGCIGVRDARTLVKRDEWPTHGIDAHQLLWDRAQPQHLIVANGGVAMAPETGRVKLGLQSMDSSLVRIDAQTGRLDGQWRLDDPRLSQRHQAWSDDASMTLGIAMQAEHDDAEAKAAASVLALFDGERLRVVPSPQAPLQAPAQTLAGYGGDIAAQRDGFVVSCPRAQGLAHFSTRGGPARSSRWPRRCSRGRRWRSLRGAPGSL